MTIQHHVIFQEYERGWSNRPDNHYFDTKELADEFIAKVEKQNNFYNSDHVPDYYTKAFYIGIVDK